jgi:DDE domain
VGDSSRLSRRDPLGQPLIGLDEHECLSIRSEELIVVRTVRIADSARAICIDNILALDADVPINLPIRASCIDAAHIALAELKEMMAERGVVVITRPSDPALCSTEKEVRWYQGHTSGSWRVDETCIRVNGEWKWLFRAVDKHGRTIDFLLTHRRNAKRRRPIH